MGESEIRQSRLTEHLGQTKPLKLIVHVIASPNPRPIQNVTLAKKTRISAHNLIFQRAWQTPSSTHEPYKSEFIPIKHMKEWLCCVTNLQCKSCKNLETNKSHISNIINPSHEHHCIKITDSLQTFLIFSHISHCSHNYCV